MEGFEEEIGAPDSWEMADLDESMSRLMVSYKNKSTESSSSGFSPPEFADDPFDTRSATVTTTDASSLMTDGVSNQYWSCGKPESETLGHDAYQNDLFRASRVEHKSVAVGLEISVGRSLSNSSTASLRSDQDRIDESVGRYKTNSSRMAIIRDCEIDRKDREYDRNYEGLALCLVTDVNGIRLLISKPVSQEATYLWDDNDERFSVENIPLYDSEEDEPVLKLLKRMDSPDFESNSKEKLGFSLSMDDGLLSAPLVIEPLDSVSMDGAVRAETKIEFSEEKKFHQNVMVSAIQSNNTGQNYYIQESVMSNKRSPHSKGKFKRVPNKEVEIKVVCELLASEEAREEIYNNEEMKKQATTQLGSLYNEIRPAIEEHERDSQDSVSTSLAEKWIAASCSKLKADFDLHSSLIKNLICTPRRERNDVNPATAADDIEMRYLTN
ncbi:hypothetical protein GIB67_003746 [Kingdonia uniflora]|uniref:Uncharacterized protein n=1 Tax=Kingdonia uniflora TaxID=39325 RepID=A0A7J7MSI4_9MAGN|nr:hypothetical protein GIB67_003746 [Kingdonia uniflora]